MNEDAVQEFTREKIKKEYCGSLKKWKMGCWVI
jgi:hypothetical protein